jgi:type II secretory pathway pseudopilin PulG
MLKAFRSRVDRADAGISLVELLVTMVLFGILGTVIMTAMIATQQTSRNVGVRSRDLSNVQVAVEAMSKRLRTAAVRPTTGTPGLAISSAGPSSITFWGYISAGKAPSQVSFYLDAQQRLMESIAATTQCTVTLDSQWTYGTPRVRVLATRVSSTTQLFTYHSPPTASGGTYAGATIATTGAGSTVPAAQLPDVDSVEINLSVDLPSSPDIPSASAITQVNLPNQVVSAENVPENAC